MDPILERIGARRACLAEQAELLGKQLAEAEAELARVAAAQQVVAQLLAEDAAAGEAAGDDDSATATVVEPGRVVPYRKDAAGPGDLSAEYQRVLQEVAAAGGPVRCKQRCERLGIGTEPRKVEAMRARRYRDLLTPTPDAAALGRTASPSRYTASALWGENVLLIDDTWTTGNHAQSAAAALKAAGAGSVAILILGRHLNIDYGNTATHVEQARLRRFSWGTCALRNWNHA